MDTTPGELRTNNAVRQIPNIGAFASQTADLPEFVNAIECLTPGNISIVAVRDVVPTSNPSGPTVAWTGDNTKAVTRACVAGQVIHVQARRILATGLSGTYVGLIT